MKMLRYYLFGLILLCSLGIKAQKIYVSPVEVMANVKVYVVSTPSQADLIVYKAPVQSYPGVNQDRGVWYFVPVQAMANKIIYYTQTPATADLKVYFADVPVEAGWQNESKRKLME